ncbi:MAG: hypothetical protein ACI9LE_001097, partial [Paraglaciecola sp.]
MHTLSADDIKQIFHELQVHQMENEELRRVNFLFTLIYDYKVNG